MLDKINGAVFDKHAVRTISSSTHHHPVTQCTTHKAPKTAIGEKTCVCGDNIQQKNSLPPPHTNESPTTKDMPSPRPSCLTAYYSIDDIMAIY